jgi:hypothetical protein
MTLSMRNPVVLFAACAVLVSAAVRAESTALQLHNTTKHPRTYYSYSYKPNTGASVKARGYGTTSSGSRVTSSLRSGGSSLYQRATTSAGTVARSWSSSGALQQAAGKVATKMVLPGAP